MSTYPDYISEKRVPVPTPAAVYEDGKVHYGTFDAPFANLNMLEVEKPCGNMPASMKKSRLTEWEAFEVDMDEGTLVSAVYKSIGMGFSIFVWYDKKEDKIYSWQNLAPKKTVKVASQLLNDDCYIKTSNSEYRISNDLKHGKADAKGYSKGKSGEFAIDIHFERISEPSVAVMPLAENKDGSFRNPLYSEKDFFVATGTITVNGNTYETNERSLGIIDDHKGYYPYRAHYDWLTTMAVIDMDGQKKNFGFNLTRNQSVDQPNYNENYIWCDDKLYPLPPVVFEHKTGKHDTTEWHVKDEAGLGLVDVTFTINKAFFMPIHLLIAECYYALPFGRLSGYVVDTNGTKYPVDGLIGIGEDKMTRM